MTVIDNERKGRVRQAVRRYRRRRQHGIHRRPIDITDAQLDALVARGYLDPDRRGDPADECDAIEMFLIDSLTKSQCSDADAQRRACLRRGTPMSDVGPSPCNRLHKCAGGGVITDMPEKVLERLATTEKCTIVVERQPERKMRVMSGSWDGKKAFLRNQVLELRSVEGRIQVARKERRHDE